VVEREAKWVLSCVAKKAGRRDEEKGREEGRREGNAQGKSLWTKEVEGGMGRVPALGARKKHVLRGTGMPSEKRQWLRGLQTHWGGGLGYAWIP